MDRLGAVGANQHEILQMHRAAEPGLEHRAIDAQNCAHLEDEVIGRARTQQRRLLKRDSATQTSIPSVRQSGIGPRSGRPASRR